jgi:hypothetical protein
MLPTPSADWRHRRVWRSEDQDCKKPLISVKIRENAAKIYIVFESPIQLTDSEIYSLREEMRADLAAMQQLQLDRQASDALSLAESANGRQRSPQPDGLPAASDGQPAGSDTSL